MTCNLKGSSYEERLREVNMFTLVERRQRGDMIEVWKLLHGKEKIDVSAILTKVDDYSSRTGMRSSDSLSLVPPTTRLEIKKNFFTNRVVAPWNALPASIKNADSIDSFKVAYDKYVGMSLC